MLIWNTLSNFHIKIITEGKSWWKFLIEILDGNKWWRENCSVVPVPTPPFFLRSSVFLEGSRAGAPIARNSVTAVAYESDKGKRGVFGRVSGRFGAGRGSPLVPDGWYSVPRHRWDRSTWQRDCIRDFTMGRPHTNNITLCYVFLFSITRKETT